MSSAETPVFDAAAWNCHALITCAEMRRAEEITYARGAASFDLMQRAGDAVANIVREKYKPCRVLVLCGPGNNGGDGFIVAEQLRRAGWDTAVATVKLPSRAAEDDHNDAAKASKNWQGKILPLRNVSFDAIDLVIDALFGIGLARAIEGDARAAIEKLNQTKIPVVAIDLPSGVNGDTGAIMGAAIKAALTVTFFRKKPGHVLLPGAAFCGEILIADIGIKNEVLDDIKSLATENNPDLWLDRFPFPQAAGNKYTRGHALIAGGAVMTGATRLAARAAQRIGAGLVTLAAPESAVAVYSSSLESVIVRTADKLAVWQELLANAKRNAVLIGPGLGLGAAEAAFVLAALATGKPCVLDADALGNFSKRPDELFAKLHAQCVLTPHEGEFARLFGARIDAHEDKLTRVRKAAKIAGCIVLLKGADTVIADPLGCVIVNANAPPWLATAGAGDVLAGFILGLLAQGMPVFAATAAAAWIHGQVAADFGPGLIAEDLIDGIPHLLRGLPEKGKGV